MKRLTAVLLCAILPSCGDYGVSPAAKGIAEAFEKSPLIKVDVSPMSISELGTTYLDHSVLVTWYPGPWRRIRTIVIDGSEAAFPSSRDSQYIFAAALRKVHG